MEYIICVVLILIAIYFTYGLFVDNFNPRRIKLGQARPPSQPKIEIPEQISTQSSLSVPGEYLHKQYILSGGSPSAPRYSLILSPAQGDKYMVMFFGPDFVTKQGYCTPYFWNENGKPSKVTQTDGYYIFDILPSLRLNFKDNKATYNGESYNLFSPMV